MKVWRVNESLMHDRCDACDDQRRSPCATVVFLKDAEAEIEKTRREGVYEGRQSAFGECVRAFEKFARDRGWSDIWIEMAVRAMNGALPEPKPLEHLIPGKSSITPSECLIFNSLVDAVKGIQAWIAGQST